MHDAYLYTLTFFFSLLLAGETFKSKLCIKGLRLLFCILKLYPRKYTQNICTYICVPDSHHRLVGQHEDQNEDLIIATLKYPGSTNDECRLGSDAPERQFHEPLFSTATPKTVGEESIIS